MKYIKKGHAPANFIEWKNANTNATYDKLKNPLKAELKRVLSEQQGYLCCYCESRLDENSHIEHIKPQSKSPESQLDFKNLLCSCQLHLNNSEPRHCGMAKDNWFDDVLKFCRIFS